MSYFRVKNSNCLYRVDFVRLDNSKIVVWRGFIGRDFNVVGRTIRGHCRMTKYENKEIYDQEKTYVKDEG